MVSHCSDLCQILNETLNGLIINVIPEALILQKNTIRGMSNDFPLTSRSMTFTT